MRRSASSFLAAIVALSLGLAGCNSTTGGSSSTGPVGDPDPRLAANTFEVKGSSAATGCVVGAAAVGLTCMFIADADKRAYCLAGAAAGCAAGIGANYYLDSIRKDYHTKEQQLNGLILTMKDGNEKAKALADSAAKVYAEDQKKLAKVEQDIKLKKTDKASLNKTLARYNGNIALLEQNLKTHQERLNDFAQVREGLVKDSDIKTLGEKKRLKEVDAQIASLQADITELRTIYDSYVRDRDVLNLAMSNSDLPAGA